MRKQVPELRRAGQTQVQTGPACGERPRLLSAPRPLSQSRRHCGNSPHPASEHLDLHSSHQEGVVKASYEKEGAPSYGHVTLQQPHTSPACPLLPILSPSSPRDSISVGLACCRDLPELTQRRLV